MKTRTWPYGTQKQAEVLEHRPMRNEGRQPYSILMCVDSAREAYVLLEGDVPDEQLSKPGDKGVLTFTEGGPTGGCWKFSRAPAADNLQPA